MNAITSHTLGCGARLLVEPMAGVRSASVCCLVPVGLISEPAERLGATGVLAEMLMRGAGDQDARAQADAFDAAGANRHIDAGGRGVMLRITTLGDRLDEALTLLAETLLRPRLTADTFEPARLLATQALASLADDPRERAVIAARSRHFPVPFNRSSYGTAEGLASLAVEDIAALWSSRALPVGTIIGVAGAVDPERVREALDRGLDGWAGEAAAIAPAGAASHGVGHTPDDSNQVQIVVIDDAPPERDEDAAMVEKLAASVLSGGMSGRLFTEVREKRGLCYAVSAGYRGDDRFGVISSYVGTTSERAQEALDVLLAELDRIRTGEGAVTEDEFARAVVGMKSNVVFHGESAGARAGALVGDQLKLGRARTLEEITQAIDAVTLGGLNSALAGSGGRARTVQTLGPTSAEPGSAAGGSS
ncbi:MAG: pitrilysin family protein [Planctomycetota bacterium]